MKGRRLSLLIALCALLATLVSGVAAVTLRYVVAEKDTVIDRYARDLLLVEEMIVMEERAARLGRSYLLTGQPQFREQQQAARIEVTRLVRTLEGRENTERGAVLLSRARSLLEDVWAAFEGVVRSRAPGTPMEETVKLFEATVIPIRRQVDAQVAELYEYKDRQLETSRMSAQTAASRAYLVLLVTVLTSLLLGGTLGYLLRRAWLELAEASAFQQRVVAIVGHDVRSPLSAVLATSTHLMGQSDLPARVRTGMQRILRSARRIEGLTALLVDYTQVNRASVLPLVVREEDLHHVCEEVLDELREIHPDRQIIHERVGNEARGALDRHRLGQVLSNLVDNALRHGSMDSPVIVRSVGTNPSTLELSVHNRGEPIPSELLPQLFEPFRSGRAGPTIRESLGLGLYIVSEISRAHGGRVFVESTAETGTLFRVLLPREWVPPERRGPQGRQAV